MTNSSQKTSALPFVSLLIFLVFQAFILLTWSPLERGEFKEELTALGVIAMPVPYGDFLTISEGIQFYERGGDPYAEGSYDFIGRRFNYPPIWLKMSFLGLSPEGVRYVYISFATLFSLSLGLLFWRDSNRAWFLYFPFIFSPPVFLALERCNNDLLMFFLIVSGIWIGSWSSSKTMEWVSGSVFLMATVLKVFPVFAYFVFLRESWKKSLLFLIPFGAACAVYFIAIKPVLDLIHENTPWSAVLSFGLNVVPYYLSMKLPDSPFIQGPYFLMIAWALACVLIFCGYRLGRKRMTVGALDGYDANLFRVGAGIYIAVFFMGSNYDYRLIFLLMTLPFAFRLAKERTSGRRWFISYLISLVVVYWVNHAYGETALLINEFANWSLLFILITLQFRMLPGFVRDMIYKPSVGS